MPDCLHDLLGDLMRQVGGHRVADLDVLLRSPAMEEIVVRKRLQAGRFPNRETPALAWIWVNEVVPVLRNVACDGC